MNSKPYFSPPLMNKMLFFCFLTLCLICPVMGQNTKPLIAVMDLDGNGVSKTDLGGLSNRLRSEIFKTGYFIVIERGQMDDILKEQAFQLSGCASDACVVEMGQLLGARYIVVGSIDRVGKLYSADIRMISVESGAMEKSATDDCDGCQLEDMMKVTIHNAARKLAGLTPDRIVSKNQRGSVEIAMGELYISSTPSGASISIDGIAQEGLRTPITLQGVAAGRREIFLIKDNLVGRAKVVVQKNGLVKSHISLVTGQGNLKIVSTPGGAQVFIDKALKGKTPILLQALPAGEHIVNCQVDGFVTFGKKVQVKVGETVQLHCALEKGTELLVHAFNNNPNDTLHAQVFLSNGMIGTTPLSTRLSPGPYKIKLKLDHFQPVIKTFNIESQDKSQILEKMNHTEAYLQRLEEKRQQIAAAKRQREERQKKAKKTIKLSTKIISGVATLALSGLSIYYYSKSQTEAKQANDIYDKYNSASKDFESFKSKFTDKKKESDDSGALRNIYLGAASGFAVLFGLTFAF